MSWELKGNSGTNPKTDFLGTTDAQPLVLKTNGKEALRVTPDGRVGIGAKDPEAQLQVYGGLVPPLDSTAKADVVVSGSRFGPPKDGKPTLVPVTHLIIRNDGRVGIGTHDPTQILSAAGMIESTADGFKYPDGTIQTTATLRGPKGDKGDTGPQGVKGDKGDGGWTPPAQIFIGTAVDGAGQIRVFNKNASATIVALGNNIGHDNYGCLGVTDGTANLRASVYMDPNDGGTVLADTISASVKYFRVANPAKEGTDIVYSCLEGPEAAAYVRGTSPLVNGEGVIRLPNHFVSVANPNSMTVLLTPLSSNSLGLAVVKKGEGEIVVQELHHGNGSYDFDWEVKAVRKGHEEYQVIRPRLERPVMAKPSAD